MPKLTATATTTHAIQIKPAIKKKLMTALRTHAELSAQVKALELAKSKQADIVEAIQVDLGESTLAIEGFKSTIVAPMRLSKGWKKKYVEFGGDLDLLERAQAASKKPGKAYVKITPPGNEEDESDSDFD